MKSTTASSSEQRLFLAADDFLQQRAGGAEEAQDQDRPARAVAMAVLSGSGFGSRGFRVIQIAQAATAGDGNYRPRKFVRLHDGEHAERGQQHEGKGDRPLRTFADVFLGDAQREHDQRKFADLAEIERRQEAGPDPLLEQVKRGESGQETADHGEEGEDHRANDQAARRHRNGHPKADEEERNEEIPQTGDLGGHVERVGKGGDGDAGNEGAHFPGELQPCGQFTDQEAPGNRADQHQLGQAGNAAKQVGQYKPADQQGHREQDRHMRKGHQQLADLQIVQAGLDGEEENDEQVLQHQQAQRDAPR
ncbi:MAG: hypothetical protein QM796_12700 [Chthoniobacteraceae bacterium]